jgi:hypothetical protein
MTKHKVTTREEWPAARSELRRHDGYHDTDAAGR